MIRFAFDAIHGYAIPDGQVEELVSEWIKLGDVDVSISSHIAVYWLRVALIMKALDVKDLQVTFITHDDRGVVPIAIDQDGNIQHWPTGFADELDDVLSLVACKRDDWGKYRERIPKYLKPKV